MGNDTPSKPKLSPAQLLAELQALTLAIRLFELDGLRNGHVRLGSVMQEQA